MFSAMEIRDAIGQLADGRQVDAELVPFVRAAVDGPCPTSDQAFVWRVAYPLSQRLVFTPSWL